MRKPLHKSLVISGQAYKTSNLMLILKNGLVHRSFRVGFHSLCQYNAYQPWISFRDLFEGRGKMSGRFSLHV